jgi:hypothetical protein
MDPGHMDPYGQSPNQTVIKQERRDSTDGVKAPEIRMNGVVAKHYNGTQYHEYTRQKVKTLMNASVCYLHPASDNLKMVVFHGSLTKLIVFSWDYLLSP